MFSEVQRIPSHRLLLLVSITFILAPHVQRIPFWLTIFCFLLILWRGLFELGRAPDIPRWLKIVLTVVGTIAVSVSFHTLMGREAGSSLLLMMLCLKLAEMKSQRDVFQCMFLGYFIVVVGFLFSQSIWMGIYMALVIVLITACLIAYTHHAARGPSLAISNYLTLSGKLLMQALPLIFSHSPGPMRA